MRNAPADAGAHPASDEAVEIVNAGGKGPFVIACEHASNNIPAEFAALGVSADVLQSHAAWDPGARAVALHLSAMLDAPLVASRISRLVYDCNRPPMSDGATPAKSEIHAIPGNAGLTATQKRRRAELAYFPFRSALSRVLSSKGRDVALVTVHSFTPVWFGKPREVEIGVLHDADARLADALLAEIAMRAPGRRIERNEPYGPTDGVTHTLIDQALPRGLPNVMLEIRNDLIADAASQQAHATLLAQALQAAMSALSPVPVAVERLAHA
ncbi:MAG TPA: N-formylglutamate amidohydrolase [Rhizobiaceae bacterium]|nr:N-formylglutamate amidohydrolase [Rhizobiaceae bacterium]